jgi:PAS domain S-box-containing protein
MTQELRVLIVEDSEDDALLTIRALKRGGYEVISLRVDSADKLRQALEQSQWDVILSDYSLPGFDAPAALKITQELGQDIPFIIISGTISEDVAVTAMKAGAHDFFSKDKMVRLVPAIERELRDAQERQKRRQAEERFSQAFHTLPVAMAIISLDNEARFVDINESALQLVGFERSELIGVSSLDLDIYVDPDFPVSILQYADKSQPIRDIETRIRRKSGDIRDVVLTADVFEINDERFILSMTRDVTEEKRAQADLLLRNRAIEASPVGVVITDPRQPDNPIIYVNPAFEVVTGYTAHEAMGRNPRFLYGTDKEQPDLALLRDALRENRECYMTLRNYRKDGTLFWNNLRIAPIVDEENRVLYHICIQNDITAQKVA